MPALISNILALVVGVFVGSAVNMVLIALSPLFIAPPAGVDMNNAAGLAAGMHLFGPRHFVMPFLAHALGTLAGALVAYRIAATYRSAIAWAIGAIFLCGGIAASVMIPAPKWFIALDLIVAYLPMAWLALQLSGAKRSAP
jgi:hypothetical protein